MRKKSERVFYRHLFLIEVLSNREDYEPPTLSQIEQDITKGRFAGHWERTRIITIDAHRMAEMLLYYRTDPDIFGLTEEGYELNEENDEEEMKGETDDE
jgi:hypothetical protein